MMELGAHGLVAPALWATQHQTVPVQDRMDGRDRGRVDVGVEAAQALSDLRRAPARIVLFDPDDQAFDLERELVGVAVGPPRPVGEAFKASVSIAIEDLVAGLSRDSELPAEPRHLLSVEKAGHEAKTLVFHVTLLPRHPCILRKGPKV